MVTKRVLIIIRRFPPHYSGDAIQNVYLAKALIRRGMAVDIVTDNNEKKSVVDDHEGVRVFRLCTYFKPKTLDRLRDVLFAVKALILAARDKRYGRIFFGSVYGADIFLFPLFRLLKRRLLSILRL